MSNQPRPLLHVLLASTRPGRSGEAVARWMHRHAVEHGQFDVELVDLAEVGLPFLDEPMHPMLRQYTQPHTKAWSARVEAADAFVVVTAEYNHGFPAPLKNAIDFLFYEWHYKPVGFVSYGGGVAGGTRATQMLKHVVGSLRMTAIGEGVHIPFIQQALDDAGTLQVGAVVDESATALLDELHGAEQALRSLRGQVRGAPALA
jgi:NAD(P)H-dependent FMN reductase